MYKFKIWDFPLKIVWSKIKCLDYILYYFVFLCCILVALASNTLPVWPYIVCSFYTTFFFKFLYVFIYEKNIYFIKNHIESYYI